MDGLGFEHRSVIPTLALPTGSCEKWLSLRPVSGEAPERVYFPSLGCAGVFLGLEIMGDSLTLAFLLLLQ